MGEYIKTYQQKFMQVRKDKENEIYEYIIKTKNLD